MAKSFYDDHKRRQKERKLPEPAGMDFLRAQEKRKQAVAVVNDLHAGEAVRSLPTARPKQTQQVKTVNDLHAGEATRAKPVTRSRVETVNSLHDRENVRSAARYSGDMTQLIKNQLNWHKTDDESERTRLHKENDTLRARYGLLYDDRSGRTFGQDGRNLSGITDETYGRGLRNVAAPLERMGAEAETEREQQRAQMAEFYKTHNADGTLKTAAQLTEEQLKQTRRDRANAILGGQNVGGYSPGIKSLEEDRAQQTSAAVASVGALDTDSLLQRAQELNALARPMTQSEVAEAEEIRLRLLDQQNRDLYQYVSTGNTDPRQATAVIRETDKGKLAHQLARNLTAKSSAFFSGYQGFGNGLLFGASDTDFMQKPMNMTDAEWQAAKQRMGTQMQAGQEAHPMASTVGNVAGQLYGTAFLYGTAGKSIEGMGAFSKIKSPFLRSVAAAQAADLAISAPLTAASSAMQGKDLGGIAKDVAVDQGLGLLGNIGGAGLEAYADWRRTKPARQVMGASMSAAGGRPIYANNTIETNSVNPKTGLLMPRTSAYTGDAAKPRLSTLLDPENIARYQSEIDAAFTGDMPSGRSIILGDTPDILVQNGAHNLKLYMSQDTARKIAYPTGYLGLQHGHNLGMSVLKNLPEQLENPVAILKNPQKNAKGLDSLIILTEWNDQKGNRIIVPIHLDAQGAVGLQNNVASTFGADYITTMLGAKNANVIYTKNNENIDQLLSNGRRMPEAMADDVFVAHSITSQPTKNNTVFPQNQTFEILQPGPVGDFLGGGNLTSKQLEQMLADPEALRRLEASGVDVSDFRGATRQMPKPVGSDVLRPAQPEAPKPLGSEVLKSVAPDSSVGAATSGFDPYSHMQGEYGTIKPGEPPRAREVDVPKSTDGKDRVSQYARTAMEAKATPDEMISDYEKQVANGLFSHNVKKDTPSLDRAVKTIEDKGYSGALEQWDDVVQGRRTATKDDIVLAQMMYAEAAKAGDAQTAMKLAAEIAAEGTRAGQNVQALRLLKKLAPEGKLYYAQRSVANLQKDLVQKFGVKAKNLQIDEGLVKRLLKSSNDQEMADAMDAIMQSVADQLPKTIGARLDAWRYFAMLGNPRTHIRNMVGNIMMQVPVKTKNAVGAGLEKVLVKDGERTKAVFKNREMVKFARGDYKEMADVLAGTSKYSTEQMIRDQQKLFPGLIDKAMKWNTQALDAEDALFKRTTYIDSLAQFLTANHAKAVDLKTATGGASDLLERARTYAIKEAQKATFQDASVLAKKLGELERSSTAARVFVGGIVPFKKTPINIVKRGLEYSPAGLANGIKQGLIDVRRGTKTAAEAVDTFASGLTGTGILALGGYLASQGLVTAGGADNNKEAAFDEMQGHQEYSLNIGDYSYTIDWSAPASLPLFVGVEAYNAYKTLSGQGEEYSLSDFLDSMGRITEPTFNLTMLDGISGAMKSATYSGSNPVSGVLSGMVEDYAGQFVPTVLGQVNRTFFDDTRRTTYHDPNSPLPKGLDMLLQRQAAKIPGLSKRLPARLDAFGREDKDTNLARRAFENFLSPGYISEKKSTLAEAELERLYGKIGDAAVLPGKAESSFMVDGQRVNLNANQYLKYANAKGQTSLKLLNDLVQSPSYQGMSDTEKADVVKKVYDYSNALAKSEVSGYQIEGWMASVREAESHGVPVWAYAQYNTVLSNARSNEATKTYDDRLTTVEQIAGDTKLKDGEKNNLIATLVIGGISDKQLEKYHAVADKVTAETYAKTYCAFSKIDDGEGNSSEKNAAKRQALYDDQSLNAEQKHLLDEALISDATFIPKDVSVDYTNGETFTITQMSEAAQKKFSNLGMSAENYAKYYPLAAQQKKKDECIQDLVNAGMSRSEATSFYAAIKSRGESKKTGRKSSGPTTLAGLRSKYLSY